MCFSPDTFLMTKTANREHTWQAIACRDPLEVPQKGDINDYMKSHTKEDLHKLIGDTFSKDTIKETAGEDVVKPDTSVKAQGQQDSRLEQVLKDLHVERYEASDKG